MNKESAAIKTTRKELYTWVWDEPVYKLALRLGISNVGLSKICKRHDIPTPNLGYWRQKECGTNPPKPGLPNPENDHPIALSGKGMMIGLNDSDLLEQAAELLDFENQETNQIIVPKKPKKLHPIAHRSSVQLRAAKKDFKGIYASRFFPKTEVSWNNIPRVTYIIDSLMKALDQRGYLHDGQIIIFGEPVSVEIREVIELQLTSHAQKQVDRGEPKPKYNSWDYERGPSGKLQISINHFASWNGDGLQNNWKDGKKQRIEDCLNQVICRLIQKAAVNREATIKRIKVQKEQRREAHRQEAIHRRIARRKARERKFRADCEKWKQSKELSDYLDAIKSIAEPKSGSIDPETRFGKWVQWAEEYIDRIDPLVNGESFRISH